MPRSQISQGAVDTGVAGTVISYPWWAQFLHDGLEILALGGGLVLVALRIRLAVIELKQKKRDR